MECPNCESIKPLQYGNTYPLCTDCSQPYCSKTCLQSHTIPHKQTKQCENRRKRQMIPWLDNRLRRDFVWRCQEMVVIAICPVVYYNQAELGSVRNDRKLILRMYGPKGMNYYLFITDTDFVSKNLVDSIVEDVGTFIVQQKHIDGVVVICSGHGDPASLCTSEDDSVSLAVMYNDLSTLIKKVMKYTPPFFHYELMCQGNAPFLKPTD
eukprot:100701_1